MHRFRLRGCHPLRPAFPRRSAIDTLCNYLNPCGGSCRSHDTGAATAATLARHRFRLLPVRSPLLGDSSFLSFPVGTEMFQFSTFPSLLTHRYEPVTVSGSRRSPDQSLLAAPRGLSQLCYVLQRLWTPRHPPYALHSLNTFLIISTTFSAIHLVVKDRILLAGGASLESFQGSRPQPSSGCVSG